MLLFKPQIVAGAPAPSTSFTGRIFRRFYGPGLLTASAATLYTVPAGRRATIRHIHVSNPSLSSVDFTLSIGADAAGTRLWSGYPVRPDGLIQEFRDHALVSGEIIQAFAGTTSVLNVTIDGFEEALTAVGGTFGEGTFGSGTFGD